MNQLPIEKRVQIINLLVEGNSLRGTSRLTGCSINTVTKLLVDTGRACEVLHNVTVRGLKTKRIEADEIRSFVYAKPKNVPKGMEAFAGEVWTWTAIDADSKLIVSWLVGDRTNNSGIAFMKDLRDRIITERIQISTDGLGVYKTAVGTAFGEIVDFAQITKVYGVDPNNKTFQYGTGEVIKTEKEVINGNPKHEKISTSYVERQNLTMRMHMRRFTRLTNAFSKKLENHWLAIALHFAFYNFVKVHKTLRVTPAMEAGLTKRPWSIEDLVRLTENENYKQEGA
jgi:IS1 family transposase